MKDKEKQIEICEKCKIKENCSHRILIHMEKCKVNDCDYFQNISTDEEKQIEEMAIENLKCGNCVHLPLCLAQKGGMNLGLASENDCCYYQPKISEDSVVLSREEYEKLKHFEHRVRSGVCMTQKEWFDFCNEDSNRRTCLRIEEREKERKETAKKYHKFINNSIKNAIKMYSIGNLKTAKIVDICSTISLDNNEIAKHLGIEIKE